MAKGTGKAHQWDIHVIAATEWRSAVVDHRIRPQAWRRGQWWHCLKELDSAEKKGFTVRGEGNLGPTGRKCLEMSDVGWREIISKSANRKKRRATLDKGKKSTFYHWEGNTEKNLDIFILKGRTNNNKSTVGWRLRNASFVGTEMACLQEKNQTEEGEIRKPKLKMLVP